MDQLDFPRVCLMQPEDSEGVRGEIIVCRGLTSRGEGLEEQCLIERPESCWVGLVSWSPVSWGSSCTAFHFSLRLTTVLEIHRKHQVPQGPRTLPSQAKYLSFLLGDLMTWKGLYPGFG